MAAGATGGGAGTAAARLTGADLDAEILRLGDAGLSINAIAAAIGYSRLTVHRRRVAMSGRTAILAARRARIKALVREGCSIDEICARLPDAPRQAVGAAFWARARIYESGADDQGGGLVEACRSHLDDLRRAHLPGCGELAIPPGPAVYMPHRSPAVSLGGSPAAACEAFNTADGG